MPFFRRPEFSMHYQVVDGVLPRDTLFLHGNLASNVWWEPVLSEWKKEPGQRGRAILAEWRGCGLSQEFSGFSLPLLAADCNALLDHLSLNEVDLVAHSTGGLIGLHAMAAEPGRYHRALLLDPVAPEGVQFGPEMITAFQQMSRDREFCAAVILGTIHGAYLPSALKDQIVDAAFGVSSHIWEGVPEILKNPPALTFANLHQPVLVAHGEFDAVLPIEGSQYLAKRLPKGKFWKLEGRGHCTNVESPKLFAALVDSFFGSKTKLEPAALSI